MFTLNKSENKEENYKTMIQSAKALLENETDLIAVLANLSALVNVHVDELNWAGFYLLRGKELVLGPFQGKPACIRIGEGKGVCGKAVLEGKPVNVPDVHLFPGHIACDSESKSELVIPFFKNGLVYGVLDLDSPLPNRFTDLEIDYLGRITALLNVFLNALQHS